MNMLKHDQRYTIEVYPFGLLICSPQMRPGVPMEAMGMSAVLLAAIEGEDNETTKAGLDSGIANALGGTFAVGTNEKLAKWRKQITSDLEAQHISKDLKWIRGVDIGLSSTTLFIALTQDPAAPYEEQARRATERGQGPHTPQDSDDLGRCIRLVDYMKWHDRMGEAKTISPKWDAIVSQWDNLCALYKDGKHSEVYDILKGINATV